MDAGDALLGMVNTPDEEVYMCGPTTEWISGEFTLHQFGCCGFDSLQISPTDVSPLPKPMVTQLRA